VVSGAKEAAAAMRRKWIMCVVCEVKANTHTQEFLKNNNNNNNSNKKIFRHA